MACSATSTSFISSIAAAKSMATPLSKTLTLPNSFSGTRKSIQSPVLRSFSLTRGSHSAKSFVVKASSELPLVGNVAPDFEAEAVFDQEFIKVKLSEYIGKKYVVLFFYPLDFTFVCPTEITAFSDRYEEFKQINTEVLGVSVDSVFSHLAWVQTDRKSGGLGDLKYPLISDVTKSISKSYGVLIPDQFTIDWGSDCLVHSLSVPMDPEVNAVHNYMHVYCTFGSLMNIEWESDCVAHSPSGPMDPEGVALRGLFIIDKEGVIQHSTINNLAIGRSVDETKRTLQALQYVQENPDEVCPAGWKPGEKSMKPDPKLSKDYFAAL
ncbi:hypothetical protein NC651_016750 [Populus alba x Populus x berolinensis]|nr:hypothetical protein NC651_016750 [Populus alba x Populus x berolinensis]